MADYLSWRIELSARRAPEAPGAPASILTTAPPFHHESMPAEVGMLLPTGPGPGRLIDDVSNDPSLCSGAMLGLFLGGPFLNVVLESTRLHRAGVTWVANLPSVDQQDEEFARQLADVELDHERELECLAQFRAHGFRTAAVVADAAGAAAAAAVEPDILIVFPRVADFAAGFPSLRQRSSASREVARAAQAAGWSGLLLGLGEARELDSEGLWPGRLDGLVCRPVAAPRDDAA